MKQTLYLAGFILAACLLSSCYKDKSTSGELKRSVTISFPEVDDNDQIEATNGTTLTITPTIAQPNVAQPDLSYEWIVSASSSAIDKTTISLSTERNLSKLISLTPSADPYTLALYVTDNHTGVQYIQSCKLYVISGLGDGWVVADTRDGATSDLTLIRSELFCNSYSSESQTLRDVYSLNNSAPFDGVIKQIFYSPYGMNSAAKMKLYITGGNEIETLDTDTYLIHKTTPDLFMSAPSDVDFTAFGSTTMGMYAVSGNDLYYVSHDLAGGSAKFGDPANYVKPGSTSKINGNQDVVFANGMYTMVDNGAMYSGGFSSKFVPSTISQSANAYDPAMFDGYTEIGSFEGMRDGDNGNSEYFHVMKSADNAIGFYGAKYMAIDEETTTVASSRSCAATSCPEIADAFTFSGCFGRDVVYYATTSKVYAAILGSASASASAVFTAPAGSEITAVKVFHESWSNYDATNSGSIHAMHDNMVVVAVYNASTQEGTLYAMPIASASGALTTADAAHTFTGFGRITAMGAQGKL